MKNRFLSLLLAVLMASLLLPATAPAEGEIPTVVVTLTKNALVEDYYDNDFTRWVEESNQVKLSFIELPVTDSGSKLAVMVAAGEYLGDMLFRVLDTTTILNYADAGVILPLDDLYAAHDTNVEAYDAAYPEANLIKAITALDGHIYSIPSMSKQISNTLKWRVWMNQRWLSNLGLSSPTTAEEFYQVLKAFKEQDANGNGDPNDEIPMLGQLTGFSTDPTRFLMNAFTYDDAGQGYQIQDGTLNFMYTTEGYREGLRYLNKLVSEGLLAPDSFSMTYAQYQEQLNKPETVVGVFCFTAPHCMDTSHPSIVDYNYVSPLIGADGQQRVTYEPYNPRDTQTIFITSFCEDPDTAFLVGDSMFTEEAFLRGRYGVEDVHWRYATEDELKAMGSSEWMITEIQHTWTLANKVSWKSDFGAIHRHLQNYWNGDPNFYEYKRWIGVQEYDSLKPAEGEYVPPLALTLEEQEEIGEVRSTINTYRNEAKLRFIMGDLSLDNDWNAYLADLDAMGLARYLEICQTAYDRSFK